MSGWTKSSDWLPLQNARAQVEFYKTDLEFSEKYLRYVQSFHNRKWQGYQMMLRIALQDVKDSKVRLAKAYLKLAESMKLE